MRFGGHEAGASGSFQSPKAKGFRGDGSDPLGRGANFCLNISYLSGHGTAATLHSGPHRVSRRLRAAAPRGTQP